MGLLASLAKPLISGGIQYAANELFSPDDKEVLRAAQQGAGLNFQGGGLTGANQGNNFVVTPTDSRRQNNVNRQSRFFRNTANEFGNLRGLVEPGFGAITDARVGEIENARRRTIGDLRENLSRRRVLGSSFAGDQLARAEAEFAQKRANAEAQGFLEELEVSTQLLANETNANINSVQVLMDELNTRLGIASGNAAPLAQALANAGRMTAEIMSRSAMGQGAALNSIAGPIGDALGGYVAGRIG
ncbi:MAG: hypothetical protein KJN60_08990 [Boseongicola sp.]|nr:hypothetical protein [Boseongicola sp.]